MCQVQGTVDARKECIVCLPAQADAPCPASPSAHQRHPSPLPSRPTWAAEGVAAAQRDWLSPRPAGRPATLLAGAAPGAAAPPHAAALRPAAQRSAAAAGLSVRRPLPALARAAAAAIVAEQ